VPQRVTHEVGREVVFSAFAFSRETHLRVHVSQTRSQYRPVWSVACEHPIGFCCLLFFYQQTSEPCSYWHSAACVLRLAVPDLYPSMVRSFCDLHHSSGGALEALILPFSVQFFAHYKAGDR